MTDINAFATDVETVFNTLDSIPIFGAFSSGFRITAGKIQCCVGLTFGILGLLGQLVFPDANNWKNLFDPSLEHAKQGFLNVIRGAAEAVASATIVGGIAFFVIQATTNHFAPIIPYSSAKPPAYAPLDLTPSCPMKRV